MSEEIIDTVKMRERADWTSEYGHGVFGNDEVLQLLNEVERLRWGLEQIARGRWNAAGDGISSSGRAFARRVLKGELPVAKEPQYMTDERHSGR